MSFKATEQYCEEVVGIMLFDWSKLKAKIDPNVVEDFAYWRMFSRRRRTLRQFLRCLQPRAISLCRNHFIFMQKLWDHSSLFLIFLTFLTLTVFNNAHSTPPYSPRLRCSPRLYDCEEFRSLETGDELA